MRHTVPGLALSAAAMALGSAASAEQPQGDRAEIEAPAETDACAAPFTARAVSDATLHATAGREDTNQSSKAELAAGVSNNSVGDNAVTGNAQIDGNAFQNMSGLSILNVNTGNNVAINAAMNVNVSISPAP